MSDQTHPEVGSITWTDITVDDAGALKEFYTAVIGWKPDPVKMGNYSDYAMFTPSGNGYCRLQGTWWDPCWGVEEHGQCRNILRDSGSFGGSGSPF